MSKHRRLLIDQLDRKILPLAKLSDTTPHDGWIRSIRKAINMTLEQLGSRLSITKQGVRNLELSEVSRSISLKSLSEVANALDMKLVYGLVPRAGSLDALVEEKSREMATRIVMRTHQTMILEDQGTDKPSIEKAIDDLTLELKLELRKSLWD